MAGRRPKDDRLPELAQAPNNGGVSIYADGLPQRRTGEHSAAFEARLKAHFASVDEEIDEVTANMRSTILLAFMRHLYEGNPPVTFLFRSDEGTPLCDYTTIERWKRENDPAFLLVKRQVEMAQSQCEARWIEHLGKMASGAVGGNIKAMEMYMKRFFNWDTDVSGVEEGRAIAEMFRGMAAAFKKPVEIDI